MASTSSPATKPPDPQPVHSILLITRTRSGPRLSLYYPPTFPLDHAYFGQSNFPQNSQYESESNIENNSGSASHSGSDAEEAQADRQPLKTIRRSQGNGELKSREYHVGSNRSKNTVLAVIQDALEYHQSNNYGENSNDQDGQPIFASLPPYDIAASHDEDNGAMAKHSGAKANTGRSGDGHLPRVSSWTKFRSKQETEQERGLKGLATFINDGHSSSATDSKAQNVTSPTPQHNSTASPSSRLADGYEGDINSNNSSSHQDKAEALAKLLAPSGRFWHKKRFEVGIEDVTFLGCPIFERRTGGWRSRAVKGKSEKDADDDKSDAERARKNKNNRKANTTDSRSGDSTVDEEEALKRTSQQPSPEDKESERNVASVSNQNDAHISSDAIQNAAQPNLNPEHGSSLVNASTSLASTSSMHSSVPGTDGGLHSPDKMVAPESLTMFHLVFVVIPPSHAPGEHQSSIQTLYKYVVKPITKALAYAQKRNNFVWNEMRVVAKILANANLHHTERSRDHMTGATMSNFASIDSKLDYKALWQTIVSKSELARAMASTYEAITSGSIAHLTLGPDITQSLQIPQVVSTPYVVTPMSPQHKGLRPSTFSAAYESKSAVARDDGNIEGLISPYSAIILLQDEEDLVTKKLPRGAIGTEDLLVALAYFVRHCLPTKTLLQLSRKLSLSQHQIQVLSMHLIRYRLALAIPPLHPSNTYIVSPNADFSALPEAATEFSRRFAMLPSLVTILGKISSARNISLAGPGPQPWIMLIPSSDHKAAYMEILEWLVRGGWVIQLRTFCWVRVSPQIKADAANITRQEEDEEAAAADADEVAALVSEEELEIDDLSDAVEAGRQSSDSRKDSGDTDERITLASAISPRLKAYLHLPRPKRPPSEAGSTSTAKTAVRISNLKSNRPRSQVGSTSTKTTGQHEHRTSDGSVEERFSLNDARDRKEEKPEIRAADFEASIIASPQRANAVESRWLKHIAYTLPQGELRTLWPRLVKYFDGKHAIEEIALREGLKRKFITPILNKLIRDEDILLTIRHW